MLSLYIPTADISPASTQPKEDEHILATIGHLPEPYIEGAEKVLAVTELLEKILLYVGQTHLTTLLLSQRVSKRFSNTIKHSIKLQRALFFELNPPKKTTYESSLDIIEETFKPRLNPFVHYPGDQDIVLTKGHRCDDLACTNVHPGNTNRENKDESWWFCLLQCGWISPLNINEDDANASWRKMWTFDPPIEIHQIGCNALKGEDKKLLKMGPLMDKVKEVGIHLRTKPGSHLESYFEEGAPRYMKIPPSKIDHSRRDREIEGAYQWAYTKVGLYFTWWMLILLPVGFGRGVYLYSAASYASAKMMFAAFRVCNDRKAAREAKLRVKLREAQREAAEKAARIAKAKADEDHFERLVHICTLQHDVTPEMYKAMKSVFYQWVAKGKPKVSKRVD